MGDTKSRTQGQALVETAITIPIVLFVLFFLIAVGIYIFDLTVYEFASNKALDKAIGALLSDGSLSYDDILKIKETAVNASNIRIFADEPVVDVTTGMNESTGENWIIIKLSSNFNCGLPFIGKLFNEDSKLISECSYYYMK